MKYIVWLLSLIIFGVQITGFTLGVAYLGLITNIGPLACSFGLVGGFMPFIYGAGVCDMKYKKEEYLSEYPLVLYAMIPIAILAIVIFLCKYYNIHH